jgi:hypothetical protein
VNLPLIVEHVLVVIVELFKEVDDANIKLQMRFHRFNVVDHFQFVVLVVNDDIGKENEAQVQQLRRDFTFRLFGAV